VLAGHCKNRTPTPISGRLNDVLTSITTLFKFILRLYVFARFELRDIGRIDFDCLSMLGISTIAGLSAAI
jgi:hypothetical protein